MRKDMNVLGKFSLNFTNIPQTAIKEPSENLISSNSLNQDFATSFHRALSQFVTMVKNQIK
jgi:hypothetical protein